ncbi:MAG: DUF3368 domain-containing protein, partial [Spirulinaceae cyanobacterium]
SQQPASGRLVNEDCRNTRLLQTLTPSLEPGEASAIVLATEIKASRLLIDERLGRRVASQYGLKIRGILGILIHAKEQGLLAAVKPVVECLVDEAGFRVSSELHDRILSEVRE